MHGGFWWVGGEVVFREAPAVSKEHRASARRWVRSQGVDGERDLAELAGALAPLLAEHEAQGAERALRGVLDVLVRYGDTEGLAKAIHAAYERAAPEVGAMVPPPWEITPASYQRLLLEVVAIVGEQARGALLLEETSARG